MEISRKTNKKCWGGFGAEAEARLETFSQLDAGLPNIHVGMLEGTISSWLEGNPEIKPPLGHSGAEYFDAYPRG